VLTSIKELKNKKAPGVNEIQFTTIKLLQNASESVKNEMFHYMKDIYETGVILKEFATAELEHNRKRTNLNHVQILEL
jgi:hypothetical protein